MMDIFAPLKWAEFRVLRKELTTAAEAYGRPVEVIAFVEQSHWEDPFSSEEELNETDSPGYPAAIAVTQDRVLVVRAEGRFVRRMGERVLDEAIVGVKVQSASGPFGMRRLLAISRQDQTLGLVFAPLWYYELRRIHRLLNPTPAELDWGTDESDGTG